MRNIFWARDCPGAQISDLARPDIVNIQNYTTGWLRTYGSTSFPGSQNSAAAALPLPGEQRERSSETLGTRLHTDFQRKGLCNSISRERANNKAKFLLQKH